MSELLHTISRHARLRPAAVALTGADETLSYGELQRTVENAVEDFADLCFDNAPVALLLDNSPIWVLLDLALATLERPVVPLPLFFTEGQRHHALAQTGAGVLIADRELADRTSLQTFTLFGRTLYVYAVERQPVQLPEGTAKITFTSGTTGEPKGVCLSQSGMEQVALSLLEVMGTEYAGIHCAVLPLAVLLENVAGLYTTLLAGGRYHVPPQAALGFGKSFVPDFPMLVGTLARCQATTAIMVPELLRGTIAVLKRSAVALPAMKFLAVGGARVSPALLSDADDVHLPVFQGYGLSETASVVTLNTPKHNVAGSVGRVLPHIEMSIADDGEILIRNPATLGCIGYGQAPSTLATGDIGHIDERGYLYIDGRKSNVLITAFGRNVAPEWVESELLSQPQIGQALVFGEDAPALGALIVPSAAALTDAEISHAIDRANDTLPEYAQVRHWCKVMPFTPSNRLMTGNGRLRRAAIHDAYRNQMERCLKQSGQYQTFFERLVTATQAERNRLIETPQIRDGLAGKISLDTYRHYLAEAYHHVKHTVSLMRLADKKLSPAASWLREPLVQYIAEEDGHDEWILDDIRSVGGDAEAVRRGKPRLATELMIAYAYDYVSRINPVGFFGMVFVLEGTSTQLATKGADALMRSLNLPKTSFRYLISHGALDLDHMQFFQGLMDRVEDEEDQAAIIHMAKTMYVLFADVFASIPHDLERAHAA